MMIDKELKKDGGLFLLDVLKKQNYPCLVKIVATEGEMVTFTCVGSGKILLVVPKNMVSNTMVACVHLSLINEVEINCVDSLLPKDKDLVAKFIDFYKDTILLDFPNETDLLIQFDEKDGCLTLTDYHMDKTYMERVPEWFKEVLFRQDNTLSLEITRKKTYKAGVVQE